MSVTATIRAYNLLNLGDCFLLKFQSSDEESYMLIDFGSYSGDNTKREEEIAKDIRKTIGDKKLTIVLTHQHKDHLSGFLHAGDFLKGKNRELWLSFLDSESSKEGRAIRSVTEKFWLNNKKSKALANSKFSVSKEVGNMLEQKESYDLFAEEQTGGKAITKLLEIAKNNVKFLTPGDHFFMPGTNEEVKVYVLGPPMDRTLLTKMNPNKSEEVHGLNAVRELANMDISGTLMLDALTGLHDSTYCKEIDFPFAKKYIDQVGDQSLKSNYEGVETWRRIDSEWLSEIGRLSLYMDTLTNNTSLVLAFELVASRKVLLFVGDAQIGNWKSWFDVKFKDSEVTGEDLLLRTVFYKSGHHSSDNATLKQGLDLMNEKELVIMIPVDGQVSEKFRFAMLRKGVLKGYHRKSQGRVLRSDTVEQDSSILGPNFPFVKRSDLSDRLNVFPASSQPHLYMDLRII